MKRSKMIDEIVNLLDSENGKEPKHFYQAFLILKLIEEKGMLPPRVSSIKDLEYSLANEWESEND